MLRNLFASRAIADSSSNVLTSYLQTHGLHPTKLAGMVAILIVPISALGWWCYSVVLSVGAMAPLQSASGSSSTISVSEISKSSTDSETNVNAADILSSSANESQTSSSVEVQTSNDQSQTTVEVNGQPVPISQEGTTHKVIQDENGQTTVDVSIDSDTSGRTTSRSSTDIKLRSSSSSDVDIRSKEIR